MFCPNCGAPANEAQVHCTKCGAGLAPQTNRPNGEHVPGFGMAIASLVLGIVSLVFFCLPVVAITCAIIGIALGGVSLVMAKKANGKGSMAIAGIACSCVALGILIVIFVLAALLAGTMGLAFLAAFA